MLKNKRPNHSWKIWLTIFVLFCISVYVLRSVLLPFVAGIIIGYLFDPITTKFEKVGMNRSFATFATLLLVAITVIPTLILLFGIIDNQLGKFLSQVPTYISSLIKNLEPVFAELQDKFPSLEPDKIRVYIKNNLANGLKLIGSVLKSLVTSGFAFINLMSLLLITPVVAFYMLRDWTPFVEKVNSLLPQSSKKNIQIQALEIDRTIASFIRGQLSVCVILGLFYATGLYIVGLDLGVLVGFMAGLISFIPYVGSIFGFIISIGIALAQFDSLIDVFYVALVFGTGQFLEGNFLTPKLVGESVGLHPVWVMFALLAGGVLLGFLGLMIAVPVAAIIGVLMRHALINYKQSNLYLQD